MDNDPRRLVIVADGSFWKREEFFHPDADVLAFSISTLAGASKGHLKLEDFCSRQTWNSFFPTFEANFLKFLEACDDCALTFTHPHSFTDSGYWLLHRLSDIYFLHRLSEEIAISYDEVTVLAPAAFEPLNICGVTLEDPNFKNLGSGLIHSLQFLTQALPRVRVITAQDSDRNLDRKRSIIRLIGNASNSMKRGTLARDLKDYFKRKTFAKNILLGNSGSHKGCILIGESGYDVDHLAAKYPLQKFVKFSYDRALKGSDRGKSKLQERAQLESLIDSYLAQELPLFKSILGEFFRSYIREVVENLINIRLAIARALLELSPKSLIFATGATNFLERSLCREAVVQGIPIYFLRHAGAELNFLDTWLLDHFCEYDKSIARTQFLINESEHSNFPADPKVAYLTNGCAALSLPLHQSKVHENKILYSIGPPAHFNFKRPVHAISDYERSIFAKELIANVDTYGIDLDLKLHPAEIEESLKFFRRLTDGRNIGLYSFGPIQRMIQNYSLIVVDIIATNVLHLALYLEKEVLLYVPKDFTNVNHDTFQDLAERTYIVSEAHETNRVLESFANGSLPSKARNRTFNQKYFGERSYEQILDVSFRAVTLN